MKQRVHHVCPFISVVPIVVLTIVLTATAAACGGAQVVKSAGPPAAVPQPHGTRYGSADAAAHALTPAPAVKYGSADAAAHALTPAPAVKYGSDAAAHALTPAPAVKYGSADAAAHALTPAPAVKYGSADSLEQWNRPAIGELATVEPLPSLLPTQRGYVEGIVSLTPEQLAAAFGNVPLHANS